MAATALPRRNATPKNINDYLEFLSDEQVTKFASEILRLRGKIRTKGDRGKTLTDKTANIERSDNWASEFATLVRAALVTVEAEYVDKIEDEEAEASTADIKSLVELHGAEAVAAALVPYADDRGKIGRDFRLTGDGFQRRRRKQRS